MFLIINGYNITKQFKILKNNNRLRKSFKFDVVSWIEESCSGSIWLLLKKHGPYRLSPSGSAPWVRLGSVRRQKRTWKNNGFGPAVVCSGDVVTTQTTRAREARRIHTCFKFRDRTLNVCLNPVFHSFLFFFFFFIWHPTSDMYRKVRAGRFFSRHIKPRTCADADRIIMKGVKILRLRDGNSLASSPFHTPLPPPPSRNAEGARANFRSIFPAAPRSPPAVTTEFIWKFRQSLRYGGPAEPSTGVLSQQLCTARFDGSRV